MYKLKKFVIYLKSNNIEDFCMKKYHVLSLSGGKDRTVLAFYIKDNMP